MRDPLASVRCVTALAARKPHGSRTKYRGGCRCLPCKAANADYQRQRSFKAAVGSGNPLVSAQLVRKHLARLSDFGIGYRAVHEACGVSSSSLSRISAGRKTLLRRRSEERVLNVRAVNAGTAWTLIDLIRAEGFSMGAILDRLNCTELRAVPRRSSITNVTAAKVDRLFRRLAA
jgi:hypothetical protein